MPSASSPTPPSRSFFAAWCGRACDKPQWLGCPGSFGAGRLERVIDVDEEYLVEDAGGRRWWYFPGTRSSDSISTRCGLASLLRGSDDSRVLKTLWRYGVTDVGILKPETDAHG
jgi:hypothetical protein